MKMFTIAALTLLAGTAFAGSNPDLGQQSQKGQQQGQHGQQLEHAKKVPLHRQHVRRLHRHRACRIRIQQQQGAIVVDSMAVGCGQLQGMLAAQGQALISYAPGLYYRFVANEGLCLEGQVARPSTVQTADSSECYVGMVCE